MDNLKTLPSRDEIIQMVANGMYSGRILNNSHRGHIVEMTVLSSLGRDWKSVSLGWHPWDLQRGKKGTRVRVQVKHCAALQLWGKTKKLLLNFGWEKKPPDYFSRDNPGEEIELEGWFCDVFVFGLHLEDDRERADQVDPNQWKFLVIPTCDLKRGQNSMVLKKARKQWPTVTWFELSEAVELALEKNDM